MTETLPLPAAPPCEAPDAELDPFAWSLLPDVLAVFGDCTDTDTGEVLTAPDKPAAPADHGCDRGLVVSAILGRVAPENQQKQVRRETRKHAKNQARQYAPDPAQVGAALRGGVGVLTVFRQDVKVQRGAVRNAPLKARRKPDHDTGTDTDMAPKRGRITRLSDKAKGRLIHTLRNVGGLTHKLTLTYPGEFPTDGAKVKADLAAMNKRLARAGLSGVWYLEWQKRGAPHFHLLTRGALPRAELSRAWYEVVGSSDPRHLRAGTQIKALGDCENPESYAVKDAHKKAQKDVPEGYTDVGKFWGVFGGLVVMPVQVVTAALAVVAPLIRVARGIERAARRARGLKPRRRDNGVWGRTIFGAARALARVLPPSPQLSLSLLV